VLHLEALDRSRDTDLKVSTDRVEQSGRTDKKKEKYARVLAQPSTTPADSLTCLLASGTVFANDAFCQLKDMLAQCMDQVRHVTGCDNLLHQLWLHLSCHLIHRHLMDRSLVPLQDMLPGHITAGGTIVSTAITRRPNCCAASSAIC